MKWTKLILMATLMFASLGFSNQGDYNYDKAWKEVQDALEKGLPKTALAKVDEIFSYAVIDNNVEQQVKSTIHRTKLVLDTEELGLETVVSSLHDNIDKSKAPTKQILQSITAELFHQYMNNNYYKISQRTNLEDFDTKDIRTWAPNNYRDFIADHYLSSLDEKMKGFKTEEYAKILIDSKNSDMGLRPTLYDLLVDRAIQYFSQRDNMGVTPSFAFKVDSDIYFSAVDEFVALDIPSEDTDSKLYRVVKLFQEQLAYQSTKGDQRVLADYDLKRLNFILSKAEIKNKEDVYEAALRRSIDAYDNGNEHSFIIQLASLQNGKGAYEAALTTLKMLDGQKVADHIKAQRTNITSSINQQSISILAEKVVPKGENFLVNVATRNLEEVFFKLVKVNGTDFKEIFKENQNRQIAKIDKLPVVRSWSRSEIRDGYKSSSHEEIVDGLDYGNYILVASNSASFGSGGAYYFTAFYVSDIVYSTYGELDGKKMFVRNRTTGKPISNAKIEVYERKYNNKQRSYEYQVKETLSTDKKGWAKIAAGGSNNSFGYKVTVGKDALNLEVNDYYYNLRKTDFTSKKTEIFLDRAIYRPGQTVHFKTLSLDIDKGGVPSINANSGVIVQLNDANGQEVSSLKLRSNDFGSATGSFVLPTGRLTGRFFINANNDSKSFSVEEYKRPTFEVVIEDQEEEIKIGDEVYVNGSALALSGSPISNGKVSYTIMRNTYYGWWGWYRRQPQKSEMVKQGTLETDGSGAFKLDFLAKADSDIDLENNPTYAYEIKVDVTSVSGETRSMSKTISVAVLPYSYTLDLEEVVDVKDLKKNTIKASTTAGKDVESQAILKVVVLEQPKHWQKNRIWGNPSNPTYDRKSFENKIDRVGYELTSELSNYPEKRVVLEKEITITPDGYDLDPSSLVEGGQAYKIEITSKEKYQGVSVVATDYIAVTDFKKGKYPTLNLLYIQPESKIAKVGEKYEVQLGTSDDELIVYYTFVRDNEIVSRGIADVDNEYTICYVPNKKDQGGITLYLDYVKHNYHNKEYHSVELPWDHKKLNVELITKRDKVLPGSKEEWTLKISGQNKDKAIAEVLATMYDASLDQFVNHSYYFNPYRGHYGGVNAQFFGFGNARSGNLNYQWNTKQQVQVRIPVAPRLQGLYNVYNPYGGISVRGSRSRSTAYSIDGVRVRSKKSSARPQQVPEVEEEAMMMDVDMMNESAAGGKDANLPNAQTTEGNATKKPEISIRKNLNESVFFYPNLKTDKDGNLLISFTMNEALTTWKLLTFAHDKDLRYGMTSHEVKTQKDLMILPTAPRFLREGDRIVFPATISNLSENNIVATASLELLDPETDQVINSLFGLSESTKSVDVNKGESARIDWELNVPAQYKKLIKYRVVAQSGTHSDGEENILPVVTNQILVTETKVISLKGQEEKSFVFDELKNKTQTSQPHRYTFEYTSNPIWYAVQALPYLMEYPHQCTEQIFNRMYANTMASHIANANPKIKSIFDQWKAADSDALLSNLEKNEELKSALLTETPWLRQAKSESEQKKRIALLFDLNRMSMETQSVLSELADRQMPSGGFPWFVGGRENVYITQNVVEGIAHLRHLGIINDSDYQYTDILSKAIVYLDEVTKKRYDKLKLNINKYGGDINKDHLDRLSIHYLYVRSFFGGYPVAQATQEAYDYYLGQSKKYWLGKGLYAEAMIGLTLKRKKALEYKGIAVSLKERSFYSDELGRYWNLGNGFNWYELPIESHAMMIEFFTEIDTERDFVEDMKIWLLKNKQTNHWKTTKATSAAIYSLLIQGEEAGMISWINDNNQPTISIGNEPLDVSPSDAEAGTGYIKKTWSGSEIQPSLGEIEIKNNNDVISWGASYYQYFEDIDKVDDFQETPLKVTRNLFVEEMTDAGPQLVSIDKNGIKPGDRLIVRIEIKVDRNMSYVHLKDMRSSAFEPENVLSGYRWKGGLGYYESTRDLASHFFISQLNKGTYVFEYPMRAVHKGDFSGGLTSIQCMYAPEFTSHSSGGRVVVE